MRITRVYTKTGDAGETSLVNGDRVSKASLRVSAYGDVDELNSLLGIVITLSTDEEINSVILRLQNELFIVGADLATPPGMSVPRVDEEMVRQLESEIDRFLEQVEPLREFILPGGCQSGAMLHLARTVNRRAERAVVALTEAEETNPFALTYLNRLSDLLFVLARLMNARMNVPETAARFSQRNS
jgi:cob(I)alamin adenosyltransferase